MCFAYMQHVFVTCMHLDPYLESTNREIDPNPLFYS